MLMFFRQARFDGGIRTGIDLNGATIAETFENEAAEPDPSLEWYVDVRFEGAGIPTRAYEAGPWLLEHAQDAVAALRGLEQKVAVGMDPDAWPAQWSSASNGGDLQITAVSSCVRRISGREMGSIVREIADHWADYLKRIPSVEQTPVT